jgi:hypothetical protein
MAQTGKGPRVFEAMQIHCWHFHLVQAQAWSPSAQNHAFDTASNTLVFSKPSQNGFVQYELLL